MEPLTMLVIAAYSAYQTFAKKNKEVAEKNEGNHVKSVLEKYVAEKNKKSYVKSILEELEKEKSYFHSSENITTNKCCELEEEKPKKRNRICEK